MNHPLTKIVCAFTMLLFVCDMQNPCHAQDDEPSFAEKAVKGAAKAIIKDKVDKVKEKIDENEKAIKAKESILKPIYDLAERMNFSAFHWLAFAAMVAGVVSFALQLLIGKLIMLAKFHFSPMEIFSDTLGLVISLVGLVLTTQAATENSAFTESAAMVLSSTIVGAIVGFVMFIWGQSQELKAVRAEARSKRYENPAS